MHFLLYTLLFFTPYAAFAEAVVKITPSEKFAKYSNEELQKHVWELERAVVQLQAQVAKLTEAPKASIEAVPAAASVVLGAKWYCRIRTRGYVYTGVGKTKESAAAKSFANCKDVYGKDTMYCRDMECGQ